MHLKRLFTALSAATLMLAGCTTLQVRPVTAQGPTPEWTYYQLGFTQYEITITRRITACTATNIALETTAAATASLQDDPSQVYEINRESLGGFLTNAKLTTTFQQDEHNQRINNRLLTINATIEDQTLPALTSLITGIGKVATVRAGAGGRGEHAACNADTAAALQAATTQTSNVKDLTHTLESLNASIAEKRRVRLAQGIGDEQPVTGELAAEMRSRQRTIEALSTAQTALDRALNTITAKQVVHWPEDSTHFTTETPFRLEQAAFHAWQPASDTAPTNDELGLFDVRARLDRIGSFGRDPAAELAHPENAPRLPTSGIRYRVPVAGRLLVCVGATCAAGQTGKSVLAHVDGPVSQLGFLQSIPVHGQFLGNVTFAATFSGNGAPSSIGYEPTGGGAKLGDTVSTALTQQAAIEQARITRAQGAPQRHLADLQQQLQVLQAQAQLDAVSNDDVQATSELNVQSARLRAEIALIEAQRQLTALNAATTP